MSSIRQYDQFMVSMVDYFYDFHISHTDTAPWARARLALLDALGCAVESYTSSDQCRSMIGPVVQGSQIPGGVRLPGTTYSLDPVTASFDLGAMIRYLDHNDAYSGREWGHPSDMLGALLAVADWQSRSSSFGRRININALLEAMIKGYEIHCLFQHKNCLNAKGYDHTILVKVASVVAVCWLLDMDKTQALAGLSHVYVDGGLLRCYRQSPNTGPRKGWAAGDACMRAVYLALLARSGQPGAPTVLTDPKWGFYSVLMGGKPFELPFEYGTYAICNSFFKLVAAEGHGITACQAAVLVSQKLKERGVNDPARDVKKISIRTIKAAITIIDKSGPLHNYADRDHCLSYMVAVVLLKGTLPTVEDYLDESPFASDPKVEQIRGVISAYEDPQLTADYFDLDKTTAGSGLTVILADGTIMPEVLVETPLGHPKSAATAGAVIEKFKANMQKGGYGNHVVQRAIETLENGDGLVSEFMDLFWKGSAEGGS